MIQQALSCKEERISMLSDVALMFSLKPTQETPGAILLQMTLPITLASLADVIHSQMITCV